ncbi:DnaJ-domain-containing protein, partial [Coccomyxa subellipsoidea C-169]
VRVKASFYTVLQVDKLASKEEIRKAYRRLARRYHPDVDGTPEAQKRLQAVIAAYNVLSDELERERYDTLRGAPPGNGFRDGEPLMLHAWLCHMHGASDHISGHDGDVTGEDAVVVVSLDFLEAALGKQHALEVSVKRTCPDCVGLGAAPGTHPVFCSLCSGRGHVRTKHTSHAGLAVAGSAACPACGATGIVRQEWCTRCGGDGRAQTRVSVNVSIPAGVDAESVLRVKGLGDAGKNRGATGDLYITFAIKPRAGIVRRGLDLYSDVIVRYTDAILGGSAAVATIRGEARLPIPPGTQNGQVLTLPGAG